MINNSIPIDVMEEVESICYFRNEVPAKKEIKTVEIRINFWLNQYQIDEIFPVIIDSYNKLTFLLEAKQKYYLVYDVNLLKSIFPFLCVYHRYGTLGLFEVLAFYMSEQNYVDCNFEKASMYFDVFKSVQLERQQLFGKHCFAQNDMLDNIEIWHSYITDFCVLHEIAHYIFLRGEKNEEIEYIRNRVELFVGSLELYDLWCNWKKENGGIEDLHNEWNAVKMPVYTDKEWEKYISVYVEYGAKFCFPNTVTYERYVEECCCDVFSALQIIKKIEDEESFENFLKAYFWMIETLNFLRIIRGNEGDPLEIWCKSIDRVNIVSGCLRAILDDYRVEKITQKFFEQNYSYAKNFIDCFDILVTLQLNDCVGEREIAKNVAEMLKCDLRSILLEKG